ncbi:membrane protein [Citrobacter koseri]|uniref:Membrane protein n=1 Tax=Citrobacter koseri TaxID=545 RepID=A0A3S4I572_CITKO|nr:membrane protein [Citrobacter koseri]
MPVYPLFENLRWRRITGAVTHYYGKKIGSLITSLYFIAFFVVVLIYAVAITNSLTEQLAKQMTIDLRVRVLVSLGVVLILNLIFLMGRHATIRVMGFFSVSAYRLFLISVALFDRKLAARVIDQPDGLSIGTHFIRYGYPFR